MDPKQAEDIVFKAFAEHHRRLEYVGEMQWDKIVQAAWKIVACLKDGGTVYACGNGGSAADAQHFVGELQGRFRFDRPPLRAECLCSNTSTLTAIANDYDFSQVFARQLCPKIKAIDVLVVFSTSGTSSNVLEAMMSAVVNGASVIAFAGESQAQFLPISPNILSLLVGSSDTPRVQEMHEFMFHIICELVEQEIFG